MVSFIRTVLITWKTVHFHMTKQMSFQICFLGKRFWTNITLKWFLSSMGSFMNLEVTWVICWIWTIRTVIFLRLILRYPFITSRMSHWKIIYYLILKFWEQNYIVKNSGWEHLKLSYQLLKFSRFSLFIYFFNWTIIK